MNIREFKREDTDKVKELVIDSLKELFKTEHVSNIEDLDDIEKIFIKFYIYEKDGEIIGCVGLKIEEYPRILRMYIKKEERGKGIGEQLINSIFEYCKGKYSRIFLTTYEQTGSMDFYKKMGFSVYKVDEKIWMEKMLIEN